MFAEAENKAAKLVPAVDRALAVVSLIADAQRPQTLAELARSSGLPKSSLLGLCTTLIHGGMLQRTSAGSYRLGMRTVELASAYLATSDLTTQFLDVWNMLGPGSEGTVVLSVLDGADMIYIATRNRVPNLTFNYRIGMRLPANCTASGKAVLSTHARAAVDALFGNSPLPRLTARSLVNVDDLHKNLEVARRRGYAIDNEELHEGMCCIGAPIYTDVGGPAAAAVAVCLPKSSFTSKKMQSIELVMSFAKRCSTRQL